jgi:RNA polymerase sigma factor for flagellar operon FliA
MTIVAKENVNLKASQARNRKSHLRVTALRAYGGNKSRPISNKQIVELLDLVPKIAKRTVTYLKPPLAFEDLVAAGTVGLVKAAKDYDPSHQAEFKTYAYIRIRGAILDELKKWNFGPLDSEKQIATVFETAKNFKEQVGTQPSDEQLAKELGIDTAKLYQIFEKARAKQFLSLHSITEDSSALHEVLTYRDSRTPAEQTEQAELAEKLAQAIQQLPEKKRQVILLYYQQELTMKEIAEVLDITESRVSQIHAAALFNLSVKLRQWKDGRK